MDKMLIIGAGSIGMMSCKAPSAQVVVVEDAPQSHQRDLPAKSTMMITNPYRFIERPQPIRSGRENRRLRRAQERRKKKGGR